MAPPTADPSRRVLLVLAIQVFIIMLGLGLAAPILPLYAQSFGVGAAAVGSLITVFGIARIFINIPAGHWTERFGRRTLLILGPLVTAVGSFGFALAPSFGQLLGWRVLQGLGSATLTTAAMVVLADISTPQNRGRIMSLYQGSLFLGVGAGPALGGLIAESYGMRAPFLIFGVLTLLAGVWALRIPETRGWVGGRAPAAGATPDLEAPATRPAAAGPGVRRVLAALARDRNFVLVSLLTLGVFFTRSGAQMTLLPLLGHNVLELSESAIGLVFTMISAINFATLYLAGSLADRFGRKSVIVPSGILTALSVWLYAYTGSVGLFVANGVLLGIGTGLGGPAPAAYATDLVPRESLGPAMGLYRTVSDLGLVLGPVSLGWLVDVTGYGAAFTTNAVLVAATTVAFGLIAIETAGRRDPTAG